MFPTVRIAAAVASNTVAGLPRQVCIVGASGLVQPGVKKESKQPPPSTTGMIRRVLNEALIEAQLTMSDIDGLVAVPSLKENHFMGAHYHATCLGMLDKKRPLLCRTIDTGGAGPISALLEAERMIKSEALEVVAVVAADSVGSMNANEFLLQADDIFFKLQQEQKNDSIDVESPAIPHGYDKITQYQISKYGLTRDQCRIAVCLESFHAGLHMDSLYYRKQESSKDNSYPRYTKLQEVQQAPAVKPNLSILECARRADGAACLILVSNRFLTRRGLYKRGIPAIIGGGESSGPLYPPSEITELTYKSCDEAMAEAYASAGNLSARDIDFFGLYDCFPICLIRSLEACGICEKGRGGEYLENQYDRMMDAIANNSVETLIEDKSWFPINTHGGLLCYGAPWEVPAMYNIIEAVHQLRGDYSRTTTQRMRGRRIENCRRALVYGNGGILSASAVAILANTN